MACSLPCTLAASVSSLIVPNSVGLERSRGGGAGGSSRTNVGSNSRTLEGRHGSSIGRRVDHWKWSTRQQPCRPLVAALNTETASTSSSSEPAEQQGPPIIELQFLAPESGYEPQTFSARSGEKNLRKFMIENKLELYTLYGKVMNCGGGGSCGTCIVEILEGQELLSERTDAEYKYLKKNPESWRLACQTIVGDKSNSGKVVVQRLPQKKKN